MRKLLCSVMVLGAVAAQADTLRFTVAYYSPATQPYFEKMARQFESTHPGHRIKIEMAGWDGLQKKLQVDLEQGRNADIAIVGTRWLLDYVKHDQLEPLDRYMGSEFEGRFIGTFLEPSQIDNKTWGLPIAASARAMYYNKRLLSQAGFPDGPKTWDDVVTASRKIKAGGGYGFGLQGKDIETDIYWYYALWSFGGEVVVGKWPTFANTPGVKAATLYKQMIDEGLTQPNVTQYSREDVGNLFKKGNLGMVISAPFLINQLKAEAPGMQYGIAPIPTQQRGATYAVTDSVVMFRNARNKALAWQFLDFLFTKEPRIGFTAGEGFLPTTKDEASAPYFTGNPRLQTFVKLLPYAKFAPTVTGWEDTAKAVSDAMQAIYTGKAEPAAALKQASKAATAVLGQ
ncbi:ABC transporter substrate-binding protein [Leeia sp.]|uniref:ABC transporter substrate-binding protein n=1 Tax=Leeia sp. TaxID=2884678 RepID=UPI0035B19FEE